VNTSTPPATASAGELRDPDRTLHQGREVRFVWDLAPDPEGGTRQAVLAILHHKHHRGGSFSTTLLNQTDRDGTQLTCPLTDWTRLATRPVSRYSRRLLDEFAKEALDALRARHRQADQAGVLARRHFEVQQ
jgi:hypothetical protein